MDLLLLLSPGRVNLLDLSEEYDSCQDFKRQMLSVINSEKAHNQFRRGNDDVNPLIE